MSGIRKSSTGLTSYPSHLSTGLILPRGGVQALHPLPAGWEQVRRLVPHRLMQLGVSAAGDMTFELKLWLRH